MTIHEAIHANQCFSVRHAGDMNGVTLHGFDTHEAAAQHIAPSVPDGTILTVHRVTSFSAGCTRREDPQEFSSWAAKACPLTNRAWEG